MNPLCLSAWKHLKQSTYYDYKKSTCFGCLPAFPAFIISKCVFLAQTVSAELNWEHRRRDMLLAPPLRPAIVAHVVSTHITHGLCINQTKSFTPLKYLCSRHHFYEMCAVYPSNLSELITNS